MVKGNFVDYCHIYVKSGSGGKGSRHLRREKYIAKGGPDGGDGGNGGSIIFKGNRNIWTLYQFKFQKHFRASDGGDGGKSRSKGTDGNNIIIEIPIGTLIKDRETGEFLYEILDHNQEVVLFRGGKGGKGNWHFRTAVRQTPTYAQKGLLGIEKELTLELKILADVGLVGFPNVGKSTLLSVVSRAKPKIANYNFTTLKPNIGIVPYRDSCSFVMADIPGIIEKASEGKGLGYYFLRHIERNSILLFTLAFDFEIDSILKSFQILKNELIKFNPELAQKKIIVAITKCDLALENDLNDFNSKLKQHIKNPLILISSHTQKGIQELKDLIWNTLN